MKPWLIADLLMLFSVSLPMLFFVVRSISNGDGQSEQSNNLTRKLTAIKQT